MEKRNYIPLVIISLIVLVMIGASVVRTFNSSSDSHGELYIETILSQARNAETVIVAPESGYVRELAEQLKYTLYNKTGVEFEIINDSQASAEGLTKKNWIALGNFANNQVIESLYYKYWTFVDLEWPGPNGYLLQSLHNPMGTGKNILIIGGSDEAGLSIGVNAFLDLIKSGETISIGYVYQVSAEYGAQNFLNKCPILPYSYTPGLFYLGTGDDDYLEAFKEAILKDAKMSLNDYIKTSFGTHLYSFGAPFLWRLVVASPNFSETERKIINNHLLRFARSEEGYRYVANTSGNVPSNHETRAALGLMLSADYFERTYSLSETSQWKAAVKRVFEPFASNPKSMEDNNYHQYSTIEDAAIYSLFTGDMRFFNNGMAELAADRYISLMSNRGTPVANLYLDAYFGAFLRLCAYVYNDGKYLYWEDRLSSVEWMSDQPLRKFAAGIEKQEPDNAQGIYVAPITSTFYKSTNKYRSQPNIPFEYAFDKLIMREGLGKGDQHIVLDGIGEGPKTGSDANSIFEYSADNRLYLVAWNGLEIGISYFNTVEILKDGVGTKPPAFVRLDKALESPSLAYTATTLKDYSNTDWTRHIIWEKGGLLLVYDEFKANRAGEYAFRRFWRTLGDLTVEEDRVVVAQKPYSSISGIKEETTRFNIIPLNQVNLSVKSESVSDNSILAPHVSYKYAASPIKIHGVTESARFTAQKNESIGYTTLLYAESKVRLGPIDGIAISSTLYKVKVDGIPKFIGIGPQISIGPIEIKADILYLTGDKLVVLGTTSIYSDNVELLNSVNPLSFEIDLKSKEVIWSHGIKGEEEFAIIADMFIGLYMELSFAEFQRIYSETQNNKDIGKIEPLWNFKPGREINDMLFLPQEKGFSWLIASSDGNIYKVLDNGEASVLSDILSFLNNDEPLKLGLYDMDGNGIEDLLIGTKKGRIYAFEGNELKWSYEAPQHPPVNKPSYTDRDKAIHLLYIDDLDGDGKGEILIGTGDGYARGLDYQGNEKWILDTYAGIFASATSADLLNKGSKQFIGGAGLHPRSFHLNRVYAINKEGGALTGWENGSLMSIDSWNSGKRAMVAGGNKDGTLWVKSSYSRDWQVQLSGVLTKVSIVGDESGLPLIVVGSKSGYLVAFTESGKQLWSTYLNGEVQTFAPVLDGNGKLLYLVAGIYNGSIYGLTPQGELMWEAKVDGIPSNIDARFSLAENKFFIVVTDSSGTLHGFGINL